MGWDTYHRTPGEQTNAEHFAGEFDDHYEILASGTIDTVFYAAIKDHRDGQVWARIILTRWTRRLGFNFSTKMMSETSVGTSYVDAPLAVLEALTPTDNEDALAWRQAVRDHHAHRAFLRDNLAAGDTVTLDRPARFSGGRRIESFAYSEGGHLRIEGFRHKVPHWRDRVASITKADGTVLDTPAGLAAQAPAGV